jgi:hypothetical protein
MPHRPARSGSIFVARLGCRPYAQSMGPVRRSLSFLLFLRIKARIPHHSGSRPPSLRVGAPPGPRAPLRGQCGVRGGPRAAGTGTRSSSSIRVPASSLKPEAAASGGVPGVRSAISTWQLASRFRLRRRCWVAATLASGCLRETCQCHVRVIEVGASLGTRPESANGLSTSAPASLHFGV